jgi:hypothetical protein
VPRIVDAANEALTIAHVLYRRDAWTGTGGGGCGGSAAGVCTR